MTKVKPKGATAGKRAGRDGKAAAGRKAGARSAKQAATKAGARLAKQSTTKKTKKKTTKGTKTKAAPRKAPTRKVASRRKSALVTRHERASPKKAKAKIAPAADRIVKIRALDPQAKCGPGTSVQQLYRVDERTNGKAVTTHLVFFDRHGWYCEHGRSCPAVADVRKSQRR